MSEAKCMCGGDVSVYEGSTYRWMEAECLNCGITREFRKADTAIGAGQFTNVEKARREWNKADAEVRRAVIDVFLARVDDLELEQACDGTLQNPKSYRDLVQDVHAEMFGGEDIDV